MFKQIQSLNAPTIMLWLYCVAQGVALGLGPAGSAMTWRADLVSRFAFSLIISIWIMADARKRGRRLCYDYDSLVFFLWPILAPIYLFQTRGLKAFITLLYLVGLWLVSILIAILVLTIRGP